MYLTIDDARELGPYESRDLINALLEMVADVVDDDVAEEALLDRDVDQETIDLLK